MVPSMYLWTWLTTPIISSMTRYVTLLCSHHFHRLSLYRCWLTLFCHVGRGQDSANGTPCYWDTGGETEGRHPRCEDTHPRGDSLDAEIPRRGFRPWRIIGPLNFEIHFALSMLWKAEDRAGWKLSIWLRSHSRSMQQRKKEKHILKLS